MKIWFAVFLCARRGRLACPTPIHSYPEREINRRLLECLLILARLVALLREIEDTVPSQRGNSMVLQYQTQQHVLGAIPRWQLQ